MSDEYCESCHRLGHGPNTCPARLWIKQPDGKLIESESKQHLLPGEVLNLKLPTGHNLEIEHTADSFTICVNDFVLFNAEKYGNDWQIEIPEPVAKFLKEE